MDGNPVFHYRKIWFCVFLLFRAGLCWEVIEIRTETKQEISSTNYPGPYPSGEDKEWRIRHDYGQWVIIFQDFNIEESSGCMKDYLEVIEDNNRPSRYCGPKQKLDIVTQTSSVKIRFHSDADTQGKGFKLTVQPFLNEEQKKKKSQSEAATASVHVPVADEKTWMFYVLLASLGCALLVFLVLITFLCLEMRKKRMERRPKQYYITQSALQWPPRKRTDSKSYGRQASNSSTAPLTLDGRNMY